MKLPDKVQMHILQSLFSTQTLRDIAGGIRMFRKSEANSEELQDVEWLFRYAAQEKEKHGHTKDRELHPRPDLVSEGMEGG